MTQQKSRAGQSQFHTVKMKLGEAQALEGILSNFEAFPIATREKLENFSNWVRNRDLSKFLYRSEIYRSILSVPGVVIDAGVLYGGSLSTWLHLGEIYEPVNYGRRIFGFDTFTGFPEVSEKDIPRQRKFPEYYQPGTFSAAKAEKHIVELVKWLDQTRKLSQLPRITLVKGDIRKTLPELLQSDKSILVALLHIDIDLYAPTKATIEACLPRMPKGAVICFDELCYHDWPGETEAVLDIFKSMNRVTVERCPLVPNVCVIRI
jgi:hypothetical protein